MEEDPHGIPPYAIIPHTYLSLGALRGVRRKAHHSRPRGFIRLSRRWHPSRRRRRAGRSDCHGSEEIGVQRGRTRADSFSGFHPHRAREETGFGNRGDNGHDCQGRRGADGRPSCGVLTPDPSNDSTPITATGTLRASARSLRVATSFRRRRTSVISASEPS